MSKKIIKESKNKKEVNSYLTDNGDIVTMMEKEWPVMTAEFRRLQREQYELFLKKQHEQYFLHVTNRRRNTIITKVFGFVER